jgi:hypothetical protein
VKDKDVIDSAGGEEPTTEIEKRTLEYFNLSTALGQESDRGLVLATAAMIDMYLEKIIRAFLVDGAINDLFEGPYAPMSSLSAKTKMCFALIDAVRKVRNVFAHEFAPSFDHPDVKKLCAKAPIFDGRNSDRDAYLHLGMNMALPLIYRDIDALKDKRQVRPD